MSTTGGVVNVNGRKLCPRIILMTDGKPTDENGRESDQVRNFGIDTGTENNEKHAVPCA